MNSSMQQFLYILTFREDEVYRADPREDRNIGTGALMAIISRGNPTKATRVIEPPHAFQRLVMAR